ncbi:hypothetical protein [Synechocystis sp. PCC 6803]|uniref:hypothetical protein n=1 Tax=Synechocystis sp. PCC 6803 TaxID=1148 RepID=UPI0002D2B48C|nr:hypothetical protein [Synechocystis sp. PCC 6803]
MLNTKGTTLNLACGELYSGCPLCAAWNLSVKAIAKSYCWLPMGGKVRPAKARLSVGFKFDGTVDYHRALRML